MKTTKLYSRITTLFLFLLFGIAIGAKSAGLDTVRFSVFLTIITVLSLLHFTMMRKRFARAQKVTIA